MEAATSAAADLTAAIGCSCWPSRQAGSTTSAPTLPTPCVRDGNGAGHQRSSLPTVFDAGSDGLLPTPTAVAYGSNRSLSAGATRRPGLHQLARQLAQQTLRQTRQPGRPAVAADRRLRHLPERRRSTVHLPRLTAARDQAQHLLDPTAAHPPMPPLQHAALHQHLTTLTTLIAEITDNPHDPMEREREQRTGRPTDQIRVRATGQTGAGAVPTRPRHHDRLRTAHARPSRTDRRRRHGDRHCSEAGISRASYYRSPTAPIIKSLLTTPATVRPELDELREQVKRLRQAERVLRREHAGQLRELKDTNATYANHIQLLTLANAELRAENHQLQQQVDGNSDVRVLDRPTSTARERA